MKKYQIARSKYSIYLKLLCGTLVLFELNNPVSTAPISKLRQENNTKSTTAESSKLTEIENHLLFTTHPEEDNLTRLARIEKQVFGQALQGEFNARLTKVLIAIGSQLGLNTDLTSSPKSNSSAIPAKNNNGSIQSSSPVFNRNARDSSTVFDTTTRNQANPSQAVKETKQSNQSEVSEQLKLAVMQARQEEIDRLLEEGVVLWRAKKSQEALDKFEQVIRLDPYNAEANFSAGIAYEATGDFAKAAASYKKAAGERPDNKDYKEALASIEKKMQGKQKTVGSDSESKSLLDEATAAYKRGEYLSAIDLFKQLDEKMPHQGLVKYNLGTLYLLTHDPFLALTYYKEAVRLEPKETKYVEAFKKLQANIKNEERERTGVKGKKHKEAVPNTIPSPDFSTYKQEQPYGQSQFNTIGSTPTDLNRGDTLAYGFLVELSQNGVCVVSININSRAQRANLQQDDIIRAVDGAIVNTPADINNILSRKPPNTSIHLVIQRGRQMGQIEL